MQNELSKIFTVDNFEQEVLKREGVVLVDFWATWCGPCRMVSPIIDELARDYEGRVSVGKVNVDEQPALAEQYRIMTIPTIMVFKDGEVQSRKSGAFAKAEFAAMIDQVL
jgi:thioredoxin 1